LGRLDGRIQLSNSSPTNPRSPFSHDQYRNWAGGAGYTIRQGLRVGASTYYGPYLDRQESFYTPGEAPPRTLPARAIGIDAEWAAGHWNVQGEWQEFDFTYKAIPDFRETIGYAEVKRVLTPRWYLASRFCATRASFGSDRRLLETVLGFRVASTSLLKVGYLWSAAGSPGNERTLTMQFTTDIHPLSIAAHRQPN
jgi:hypothetical protein